MGDYIGLIYTILATGYETLISDKNTTNVDSADHLTKADIHYSMEWSDSTSNFCNTMNLSAHFLAVSDWFSTCLFRTEFQRYYLGVQ